MRVFGFNVRLLHVILVCSLEHVKYADIGDLGVYLQRIETEYESSNFSS